MNAPPCKRWHRTSHLVAVDDELLQLMAEHASTTCTPYASAICGADTGQTHFKGRRGALAAPCNDATSSAEGDDPAQYTWYRTNLRIHRSERRAIIADNASTS